MHPTPQGRVLLGLLFCLVLWPGCSKSSSTSSSSPAATSSGGDEWKPFPLPAYTRLELEELSAPLRKDAEEHSSEIEALFLERERLPLGQRYAIPAGPEAYTARQFEAAYHQFRREQDLESYRKFTADQGVCRERSEEFLTEYLRLAAYQPEAKSRDDVRKLADAAVAAGSQDPIILAYTAVLQPAAGDTNQRLSTLRAQRERLNKDNSSPLVRGLISNWIWDLTKPHMQDTLVDRKYEYAAIDDWVSCLAELSQSSNQRTVLYLPELFFNKEPREQQQEFLLAAYSNGQVHPWIMHYLTGRYFSDLGYDHRGTAYADKVTPEGWANLAKFRGLAQTHLLRAWQLAPEHPQPAAQMQEVALTGHSDRWSGRDWFYETVRAQIDWMPAYSSLENSLKPRWGGSYEALEQLAVECLATERYDTCVPTFLTTIVWTMQKETGRLRDIARRPDVAVLVRKCAEGLSQAVDKGDRCPGAGNDVWAQLAIYLLCGEDYESARKCFERMQQSEKWLARPQGWIGLKVSHARGLAYAATGPAADNVIVFEELLNNSTDALPKPDDLREILALAAESKQLDPEPRAQPYYADVETVARQLLEFQSGGWVNLPFDAGLSGWYLEAASMEVESDGTLRASSEAQDLGVRLQPQARFPPPFVCEVEMCVTKEHTDPVSWTGLLYGRSDHYAVYDQQPGQGIYLRPHQDLVMMYDQGNEDKYDGWGVKMPQQEFHLLRLKVWENALDYSIDHADIATEPIPSGAHALGFTIGEFLPGRKPNQMRVRNVRIRRADWGPPPTLTDADAFIAFNLAERDNDPLDPNAWSNLATGHLAKRDFKSALAAIEGCERLNPQHVNTGYVHGHILLSKGDYAAAIPHYRRSIERKPNHMESHSNLAWILAAAPVDSVRDPEEALMLAQRACALANYEHWMPLTALAGAHAERGEFEAARKWIALALELAPENSREITLKRQAEIGAGRPLRDEPTLPTSESTPAQPADAASPPSPTAGESADVSSR